MDIPRRTFLGTLAGGLALGRSASAWQAQAPAPAAQAHLKGQFKQGVTRGEFTRFITSTPHAKWSNM